MPRRRQQMIRAWLAKQHGKGQTSLDYVCERLMAGDTLVEISREIEQATAQECPQHSLRRWLQDQFKDEDVVARFTAARKIGASADVERAQYILDHVPEVRDAIAKAKARADFLVWKAGVNDRAAYGPASAQAVTVNLNVAALHLDALRQRKATASLAPPPVRALPAEADVIEE